jgi:hypothetical protein
MRLSEHHPRPEIGGELSEFRVGNIVCLEVRDRESNDMDTSEDMAPSPLKRQPSTYGFSPINFTTTEYYIVAHRYKRTVVQKDNVTVSDSNRSVKFDMMVLLPIVQTSNPGNGILTWLLDAAGWIRTAEDFSPLYAITKASVVGNLEESHHLYERFSTISFTESGSDDDKLTVFESNDLIIVNIDRIYIPFA